MPRYEWSDIRIFLEVVDSGSAMAAADRLGINYTTVYRRVSALEERLGKRLFSRSNQGWKITSIGERIVPYAKSMAEGASCISRLTAADRQELTGLLRVNSDYCADRVLMPAARLFVERYPEVSLQILASAEIPDIAAGKVDLALRVTDDPPPDLIGKRVARVGYAVYASAALREAMAAEPDRRDMPCIAWVSPGADLPAWIERGFPETRRVYRTTSLALMLSMAREGIGVAKLPCVLGEPDPVLERLPECLGEPGPGLWLLCHVDLRTTARVRIFRDLILAELDKQRDLIEGRRR
jgi:DNA-binding transcriptional LysR family regulator